MRKLVELYEGRPFAIVGVNAFDSEETFRAGVEEFQLSWISAFQGEAEAPISEMYRVSGYPVVLLVDQTGKIRARAGHIDDALIEKLVAEAEKK